MKLKTLDKKWVKQYSNLEIACVTNMGEEWRGETKDGQFFILREQAGIVGIAVADTYDGLTKEIKLLCAKDKNWAKMIMDDELDQQGNTVKEQITIYDIISFMNWECDSDQIWE